MSWFKTHKCKKCSKEYEINYKCRLSKLKEYCKKCRAKAYHYNRKQKLLNLKGGKCSKCGYDRCMRSLSFHHLNPKEKTIGRKGFTELSFKDCEKEFNNCIILCMNCHAETHSNKENYEKFKKLFDM